MKKSLLSLAIFASLSAAASPVGIASGASTGTNYPMAENIKTYCSTPQTPITNVVTNGSIENIFRVHDDKTTQYGITQVDAAAYQRLVDPKMMEPIVMVFPFFSTEFHLIAKDGSPINNITDLAGKRVIEGPDGSGTWVTVQMIKRATKIQWQTVPGNLGQQAGLDAVKSGQADAEFVIAGKPVTMLTTATGIKLVNISTPALDQLMIDGRPLYTSTMMFPDGKYPFQKQAVRTYKVDNMLITYNYKNQYVKEIGELVTCITRNIDNLRTNGHDKWKDVNPLDIDRISWQSHPAAVSAIKRSAK